MKDLRTTLNNLTKEQIGAIMEKALHENVLKLPTRYVSLLENAFAKDPSLKDEKESYMLASIVVPCIISVETMQQVLCELLGLEDADNPNECTNTSNTDSNE